MCVEGVEAVWMQYQGGGSEGNLHVELQVRCSAHTSGQPVFGELWKQVWKQRRMQGVRVGNVSAFRNTSICLAD